MTLWPVVSRKPKEEFERVGIERREVSLIAVVSDISAFETKLV